MKLKKSLGSRPRVLVLQETFLKKEEMLKLKIRGYRVVAATSGAETSNQYQRRGCAILVDLFLNVQPLKEITIDKTELLGVKVVCDTEQTYVHPFEHWTAYSGPIRSEAIKSKTILVDLCNNRKSRLILTGDLNSDLSPGGSEVCKAIREVLEKMEEEGQALILNEYDKRTKPNGTLLYLAVTMGNWLGVCIP